jgi:threonine/homoserine/homoserine lactone efflux protein
MGEAIGEMLPGAVAVAISPLPVIVVVIALVSAGGRRNGLAFLAGHVLGVAVPAAILLALAGVAEATERGEPVGWVSAVMLLLGLVLVALGIRQWWTRRMPADEPKTPGWMRGLERFGPVRMAATGVVLSAANLKNLIVIAAAVAGIVQSGRSAGEQVVALAVFTAIAASGVALPVVVAFALGPRSVEILTGAKTWLGANSGVIMGVIMILIGAKLIGDGIEGLAA